MVDEKSIGRATAVVLWSAGFTLFGVSLFETIGVDTLGAMCFSGFMIVIAFLLWILIKLDDVEHEIKK